MSLRLSARHTTRTRRDPRRAPRPRHAHRPVAAPAGQHARSRERRNIFFGSSSSSRRRRWCVWVIQELAEMPRPTENEAGLTAPRPTRGVPERSASGDLRTCLVPFFRCDAAAGRPGGCEHFPCLGHSCMTSGQATNHGCFLAPRSERGAQTTKQRPRRDIPSCVTPSPTFPTIDLGE